MSFNYSRNVSSEYITHVAKNLSAGLEGNTLLFPEKFGRGYIRDIIIEEGFIIRCHDYFLTENIESNLADETQDHAYKLLYDLQDMDATTGNGSDRSILMYCNEFVRSGIILKNQPVFQVELIFTGAWLENNYPEAGKEINKLIKTLNLKKSPIAISRRLSGKSLVLVTQLGTNIRQNTFALIHYKLAAITLINEFLNKIVDHAPRDILSYRSGHYETIIKVEEKLVESVSKTLPSLQEIALEFNLSLSTLQRHFRLMFGKNIYEYYQEKRMVWGKYQIETGNKNISEVAYDMGFCKVNNFSKAFKKQFKINPGILKPKNKLLGNNKDQNGESFLQAHNAGFIEPHLGKSRKATTPGKTS